MNKILNVKLIGLVLLFVFFSLMNLMVVYENSMTPLITFLIASYSFFLLLSGVGLLLRKKWALWAFMCFASIFLFSAIYFQFGLMEIDWIGLVVFLCITSLVFLLLGALISRLLEQNASQRGRAE